MSNPNINKFLVRVLEMERLARIVTCALVSLLLVVGLFYRFDHYLVNYSLWLDESMLAFNILNVDFFNLIDPLPFFSQTSPLFYLWFVKACGLLFGYGEHSLRAISIVSGAVAFLVSILALYRYFSTSAAIIGAMLFALNAVSIRYSVELKHYSAEAMSTALLVYFYIAAARNKLQSNHLVGLAVLGSILVWVSNNAILILFSVGVSLLVVGMKSSSRRILPIVLLGSAWAVSFILNYFLYTNESIRNQFELHSHVYKAGFVPLDSMLGALSWFFVKLTAILSKALSISAQLNDYKAGVALLLISFYGIVRNFRELGFIVVLIFLIFILSAAKLYPFLPGRYTHFMQPIFIVAVSVGFFQSLNDIRLKLTSGFSDGKGALFKIILVVSAAFIVLVFSVLSNDVFNKGYKFNRHIQETRPVIEHYIRERSLGDSIFVYYGALPAFEYYTRGTELNYFGGLDYSSDSRWVAGPRNNIDKYLGRLKLAIEESHNLYVLFSHFSARERDRMVHLMEEYGHVTIEKSAPGSILMLLKKQ